MNPFTNAIVITGGIGSGKSTVGSIIKLYGYTVLSADKISSETIMLEEVVEEIKKEFGEEFIHNKVVDKEALGKHIFADALARKRLENIMHPRIKQEILRQSAEQESYQVPYFIDIPLFFETKSYDIKNILLVYADKETQVKRVVLRNKIGEDEAKKRVESQISNEEKRALATFVIDNTKDLKHLQIEVEAFLRELRSGNVLR